MSAAKIPATQLVRFLAQSNGCTVKQCAARFKVSVQNAKRALDRLRTDGIAAVYQRPFCDAKTGRPAGVYRLL